MPDLDELEFTRSDQKTWGFLLMWRALIYEKYERYAVISTG